MILFGADKRIAKLEEQVKTLIRQNEQQQFQLSEHKQAMMNMTMAAKYTENSFPGFILEDKGVFPDKVSGLIMEWNRKYDIKDLSGKIITPSCYEFYVSKAIEKIKEQWGN